MPLLIHVAVAVDNTQSVQSAVNNCCEETGDIPIGRRYYEDVGEMLLVVQLINDLHLSKHVKVLSQALHQRAILSFQFEHTHLVTVHCQPSLRILDVMHDFPLSAGESWFPAIADEQMGYLCTRGEEMKSDQVLWFEEHQLDYGLV
jgi:hypothetical protein